MLDSSLMQLMWLASPALPIGGFSYSECLEAAVDAGLVATEKEASTWLLDQLRLSVARADLPVVAQAIGAWRSADHARIATLNAWVLQTRESSELRAQAVLAVGVGDPLQCQGLGQIAATEVVEAESS